MVRIGRHAEMPEDSTSDRDTGPTEWIKREMNMTLIGLVRNTYPCPRTRAIAMFQSDMFLSHSWERGAY